MPCFVALKKWQLWTSIRRQQSFKYFLRLQGSSEVQVCKLKFCLTFDVTSKRVDFLCKRIPSGELPVADKQGGKVHEEILYGEEKIIQFIASIPSRKSHYSKNDNHNRRHLSPELNKRKLHSSIGKKYEDWNEHWTTCVTPVV